MLGIAYAAAVGSVLVALTTTIWVGGLTAALLVVFLGFAWLTK